MTWLHLLIGLLLFMAIFPKLFLFIVGMIWVF
jgi:hypothetical protein